MTAWLMGCIRAISAPPASIEAAFVDTIHPYHQRLVSSDVDPALICAAIEEFGYLRLLGSYPYWYEQNNRVPMMLPVVKSIRKSLCRGHIGCIKALRTLMNARVRNWACGDDFYCEHAEHPFRFANVWLSLHDSDNERHIRAAAFALADSLSSMGVVSFANSTDKPYRRHWSSCGRKDFIGDKTLRVDLCKALAGLMERLWIFEAFRSAYNLQTDPTFWQENYRQPFTSANKPFVLVEAGSGNTLEVWIWHRGSIRQVVKPAGARAQRRHARLVKSQAAQEEVRIRAAGNPLDRLHDSMVSKIGAQGSCFDK
ncbi:MAG: hypothetical protein Q7U94_06305 [Sideroxyarcus sp.]|nr:hypothetical protein [Sideroxyarcus sp.]